MYYFLLVLDHADATDFGRVRLAMGRTSNHARINVRIIARRLKEIMRVLIVADAVMHRRAFEVLGTSGTWADHVRSARVYDWHVEDIIIHLGKLQ